MGALLNWDRDDHFAMDHGISGISRKTVEYCGGMVDIGFTSYPVGELLCQFLNYDFADFLTLKRQRDGRISIPAEKVSQLLTGMPYYRDLMAQLEPDRRETCARLFCQYQRGALWQDAEECYLLIENRYQKMILQSVTDRKEKQDLLSFLAALPAGALNSPGLGMSLRVPAVKPEPTFLIRDGGTEPKLAEQYRLTRLSELLYLELIHLLRSGGGIQKCRNCGRYFLPERGYHYRYCDQVAPGESVRTCRDIGAAKTRQSKLEGSAALTIYQRAYKRYYARVLKGQWSKEQFQRWQVQALKVRSEADADHWSGERLEECLHSIAEAVSDSKKNESKIELAFLI
ncbi:MAG: DUF6076 domain-containing protein [Eubacteriales bacterium]|nr:DUF6076 domain-containing protein [Eubacteriales bacterium]